MAYIPLPPSGSRVQLPGGCLNFQPGGIQAFANVSAVRADEATLERLSRDAGRFFAERGRLDFLWFLGPRTTPLATADLLASSGAATVGDCTAMLLDHEPTSMPGVEVEAVTTAEQLLTYRLIGAATEVAGGLPGDQAAQIRETNEAAWRDYASYRGRRLNYLAYLDGEPVTAAGLLLTEHGVAVLSGAATLPAARGKGLYRALVHTRWLAAQERKAGPLAVQASAMSAPVQARIGFREVARMTLVRQTTAA